MNHNRIDFAKVLDEIAYLLGDDLPGSPAHVPVSQERLADHLRVPRGTLRGWKDGSEPRHADGEQLIEQWCLLTGKARTFIPLIERRSYSAHKVTSGNTPRRRRDDDHGSAQLQAA